MAPTGPSRDGTAPRPRGVTSAADIDTADWPAQVADAIEQAVQSVREMTTGRAITVARWVVAGLLMLVTGIAVVVLVIISLVRLIDAYLPDAIFGEDHVWVAHLIVGLMIFCPGVWLLSKRSSTPTHAP